MKGVMNYVHEKALKLSDPNLDVVCDVYIIQSEYSRLLSFVVGGFQISSLFKKKVSRGRVTEKGGVVYHNLWHTYSIWDNLVTTKLFKRPQGRLFSEKCARILKNYDVIATHDISCHYIALLTKRKYGTPYVATWHGSDINLAPQRGKEYINLVKATTINAAYNLYVSKALLSEANKICAQGNKEIIYTGPSSIFEKYSDTERERLRKSFMVSDKKVIAFIGNLFPIKNVLVLPDVFKVVSDHFHQQTVFWIIGDGKLETLLNQMLIKSKVNYQMWGRRNPEEMPMFMNMIDVLVLPSLNEGLPLVTLEALKCGAHVVGSDVGGISESIGKENVITIDADFVQNIANRIIELLSESSDVLYPEVFSWKNAVKKEVQLLKSAVENT